MSTTSTSGRWPVILAGRAIRELRHLGRDLGTLDIVQKKFRELSHGHFSVDNHLVIRGTSENLPIYRARVANDLRIIYQIDLTADPDAQFDHQVIKVFSVSPRARVSYNFWVKVSKYLVRLGTEYRKRCTFRSTTKDTGAVTYLPAVFAHQEYHNAFVNNDYTFEGEIDSNELHETLVLEKFTPITKSLYNSILADMEAVLPMALNPDEKRIVRHPGTSVVVGRSGTGKTTALVYKLRANAQTAAALEDERPIRQLFVTRSRVLTKHIAANYQGLVESSEIANKTRDELAKIREKNNQIQKRELVEFDNEVDLRDDLPDRFSCLKDSHFPLFVSFEKLCALLEGDIASTNEKTTAQLPITFADFKYGHWPKINHALTRNLDPSLVYSEILGVIKGCGEDISREEYISNMSHKRSPLLLDVRDRVYGIFEAYSKRMHMKNQIDAADRTRKILNAHYLSPPPELLKVDYIFVDEVQDHLMLDVHLLQSLCSNPDGGYWCGDTAQTISVGSSFRIKDLKAFIYQNMVLNRTLKPQRKVPAPFTTFELSVNFRSHGGIVRYAASLVELIYILFPNSIDHMAPETARIHGPPPLLFVGSQHDKEFVQNLVGEKISGNTPFGAHQAIIVRSQSTADSLTTQLQKRCTILTILETKGLEFDDVIIYNFFSESEAPASCWRALLALSTQNENGRICYDKNSVLPSTSPILCSELKQLYVAVTRARYRCWLWDSGEAIDLMKMFWADFGLITVSESLENVGAFPASSNDLREWTRRGQDFFSSGLYALAKSCFERASQFKEATISDAYQHMSEAKQTRAKADYIKAAGKMEDCANRTDLNDSDNVLWYHAATCFEAAGDVPSASRSYRNGRFYNRAAQISFDNQNFDDCLLTLLRYSNSMDPSTFERIREASRMYYLRASNYKILRKLFDNNQDACIEYARSTGFSAQHKDLLKENNRFDELASVHLAEGFPAEAVGYMLKASKNLSTISRVETIASNYLWLNLSLDSVPNIKIQEQARQLLEILAPFDELLSKKMAVDVKLFKAAIGQHEISLNLASNIDDQDLDSKPRLVLGYHHALHSSFKNFGEMSVALVPGYLKAWHTYAKNITSITEQRSPIQLDAVQKLLGCSVPRKKPRTGRFVHVSSSSFIYVCLKERGYIHVDKKTSRGENLVAIAEVDSIVKHELLQRLNSRLMGLHIEAIDSPWMGLSVAGDAVRTTTEPFAPSFEDQIQMLSLTTTALNSIRMLSTQKLTGSNITTIRSIWVVRLFNLVFPPTGITRDLLGAFQPHGCGTSEQGIYNWVNEHLQSQDPKGRHFRLFLTMLIMGLSLSYELNGLLVPRHNTQSLQSLPRFLVHNGCSTKSECLVTELSCLFQHDNSLRVIGGIRVLQHIIDSELEIDAAVLVHLVERLTREAILAERVAVGSQLLYGISGLIMPLSWARSLTAHLEINEYTLKVGPLRNLILCIGDIIQRLQGGVPGIWAMPCTELWRHSAYSLATRMYRCLALVIVNVPPDHRDLNTALDIIQQDIRCFDMKFECETSSYGNTMGSEVKTLRAVHNQHTCLSALTQTLHHEELVLLENGVQRTCPAKQKMISRIIYFTKLVDLRQKLRGHSAAVQTSLVITAEDQNAAGSRDTSTQSPNEQTGVAIISDAIDSLPEYSAVTRDRAAQRIQLWWRRHCERQDHMGIELNQESACYQRFVSFIPKVVTGTSKRDRLLRNILRGPGLLVIISLESICDQLEELLEAIRQGLQASGISGNNIVDLQKRQKAANEIHQKAETLRKEMSPDSPSGFKVNNLSAVKSLLTGKAKTLLGDIKTSKLLDGSKLFEETEVLLLRGVEIIRAARAV